MLAAAGLLACWGPAALGASSSQPAERESADAASAQTAQPKASSDADDLALLSLEVPTVVTATRREQKITSVPYAMSVVTAEDIRRSGARTVGDALRLVPGVDVAELGFNQTGISPRGFHGSLARTMLVLIDGRQVYDSVFGGTLWGSWPILLEDIDHIEVVRGPGGVTWGSNAMDGVINVITKDPKDQLGLTHTSGGGFPEQYKEYLGYGFTAEKLRMRVSGEWEKGGGFTDGGTFLRALDDQYQSGRMSVFGIYDASPKDKVTFSGGSNVLDHGYATPFAAGVGDLNHPFTQAEYLMGKWAHTVAADNSFEVTGYVNDFQLHHGAPSIDYRYQQLALQFGHTFKPTDDHTLTWGIDSRTDIIDASNGEPICLSQNFIGSAIIGAYLQDEWRFAPKWALNLGGRLDYDFYGGFQPSARASLSYDVADNHSIYGAVSRAFQMPAVGLRFLDDPMLNGLGHLRSPRDLDAETLIAYEIGYRGKFFDRLDTSINLYMHDYDDVTTMSPRLGPPGLVTFYEDNTSQALTYGVEADARYALSKQITLLGNYTYQQMNWDSAYRFTDKDLMTHPKHKFMLGVRYDPLEDLHLSSSLYYVDAAWSPNSTIPFFPRHVSRYFRLDLRAEYEFWKKQASVAVGVRNLIDPHHYEGGTVFLNNAEVPRMVYAEVRISLK